jgi:hypothetical protein
VDNTHAIIFTGIIRIRRGLEYLLIKETTRYLIEIFTREGWMKKIFNKTHVIAVLLAVIVISLMMPVTTNAYRDNRARFLGPVTMDRLNIVAGSIVTARIDQQTWSKKIYFKGTDSWYYIDIPKNTGQGGGLDGQLVYFSVNINGEIYDDPTPAVWRTATDVTHPIRLTSHPISSINITTLSLPEGVVDTLYAPQVLEVSGGTQPYNWEMVSGATPDGIELSDTGIISGTPTADGYYTFTVKVTDNMGLDDTQELAIRVWKLGDANQDGKVSRDDVLAVIKMYLGLIPVTPGADANKDGKVDMADVVAIQQIYTNQ